MTLQKSGIIIPLFLSLNSLIIENAVFDFDAVLDQFSDELWPQTGGFERPLDDAALNTCLMENEYILHNDRVAFHSLYLGHLRYPSCAILQPAKVNYQLDG